MLINPLFLSVLNNEGILLSLSVPAQRNITDYSSRHLTNTIEENTGTKNVDVGQTILVCILNKLNCRILEQPIHQMN